MEQKKIVMEVFSDVPIKIKINFSVILSEIVLRFVSYLFFFFSFTTSPLLRCRLMNWNPVWRRSCALLIAGSENFQIPC